MSFSGDAALVVSASAVVAGVLATSATGSLRAGVPVMLELLTAAGLLRLTADASTVSIGAAATLIAIRQVVTRALRITRGATINAARWPSGSPRP